MKRIPIPELLDSDAGTDDEIAGSLADLRRINRWFGSIRAITQLIQRVAALTGRTELSFLDVAGASGDIAAAASKALQQQGISLSVTILDRNPSHLNGNFRTVVGDALALPFCDKSWLPAQPLCITWSQKRSSGLPTKLCGLRVWLCSSMTYAVTGCTWDWYTPASLCFTAGLPGMTLRSRCGARIPPKSF